jgi:hypothetical protein
MWPSLETATRALDIANLVLIGSLALGIAAAVVIVWMGNVKESHWAFERKLSQQRLAQLGSETERAARVVEAAKAREAVKPAEAAKVAEPPRVNLAHVKAPRTLSPEQQERIAAKLRSFAGKRFDAALVVGDKEAEALLKSIESALTTAGWVEIEWKGSPIVLNRAGRPPAGDISLTGVHIQIHPEQATEFEGAVATFASALIAEGIDAKVDGNLGVPNHNPNAVHVLIGKQP